MRIVNQIFKYDVDEPVQEPCSECQARKPGNPPVAPRPNKMHRCTECGRYWIFGQFTNTFASIGELERWLNDMNHTFEIERADAP